MSLNRDLNRVSMWCILWRMKFNASKSKTLIVPRSRIIHSLSTTLTLDGTALKESADLVILGVMFDSTMTFDMASSLCLQSCGSEAWYQKIVLASIL